MQRERERHGARQGRKDAGVDDARRMQEYRHGTLIILYSLKPSRKSDTSVVWPSLLDF